MDLNRKGPVFLYPLKDIPYGFQKQTASWDTSLRKPTCLALYNLKTSKDYFEYKYLTFISLGGGNFWVTVALSSVQQLHKSLAPYFLVLS